MSYADQYDPDAGVAIVGMAGRFPGANDIRSLWRMLQAGRSGIRHFEAAELESSFAEDMQARAQPGYVAARGVLDDVACFDEGFFGFSPAEAALLDPQQRLFLQACWEALEDAACDPARFDGLMGVFAGATANSYYLNNLMSRRDVTDRLGLLTTQMANQEHYLATRVAYKLDLRGPALSIHTACSTSLVAVATAVQSLQAFQCDMALAGGVSVTLPQRRGYRYQEGSILSPDGQCRPFDAQACGTVFSNGLGVVVLRRLDDALAAGDRIYAVIKGAALNNDGRGKLSFTAPSVTGQAECVAMAQAMAGIDPQTIQYVEAHGTGTALGDPIEVRALTQAFRAGGAKGQGFCALGSLKASLGHLDAAAGVAGLIRAALALHHRELPGQPNFRQAHPELELDSSPFVVHSTARPWPRGQHPRRAAVSSLGVGGTNAHLVLEEPPVVAMAQGEQSGGQPGLVVVSARDPDALRRACERLSEAFAHLPDAQFQGAVQTLQRGRQAFAHRVSVVASSAADAARQLAAVAAPASPRLQRAAGARSGLKLAFLMAGQGAQRVLAWHGLYEREPVFRNELDSCLRTLKPLLGRDLTELLFPQHRHAEALQGAQQLLDQTQWAQPAIVSLQLSLARLYAHWGVEPAALLGHSVGEWTAACLAGSFSRDDTLAVVAERGRLMQQQPPGVMLAVRGTVAELQPYLSQQVVLAACNGPRLNVLAGPPPAMKAVADALRAQGLVFKALATSHAFHSPMMDSLLPAFEAKVAEFRRSAPRIPWVSGLTGQFVTAQEAQSPAYWARQLREPVQFSQGLATLLAADHALLDIGPGDGMSRLARQQPDAGRSPVIVAAGSAPLTADAEVAAQDAALDAAAQHRAVIAAAGELWQVGAGLNVDALSPPPWRRVDLPTYPFARNTHWVEPALPVPPPTAVDAQSVHRSDGGTSRDKRISVTAPLVPVPSLDSNNMDVAVHFLPRLRELVAELSGVDAAGLDPQSSFLELGLDSLALTQLAQSLHREWGVRVPLRRLLEDVSTVQALATELAPQVPTPVLSQPSAVVAPMPAPAAVVASPVPLATFSAVAASMPAAAVVDASPYATLFAQQLAVIQQQLKMLQAGAQGAAAASAPPVAAAPVETGQILQPTQPEDASPASPAAAFGPYRPPSTQRSPAAGLGPGSAASLQAFVARYTAHTAQSKRMTQASRAVLADPRSVSGYRQWSKELVYPLVTTRSQGSRLWDVDGHELIDITNGFGMVMFGHNPPFVKAAVQAQLELGYEIGPQSPLAGTVAADIAAMVGLDRVAFCSTGSEAVMAAMRLARTVTGRDTIVMFAGAYHGVFDEVLVRPGPRADGAAQPIAPGIPASMAQHVKVLEYGSPQALQAIRRMGHEVAAVLVEPVQSRRPELQPREFLQELRAITEACGAALVFDEVVTGFRVHPGGAQALFGVRADMATYGKVLGGGLPIGVVAGSARFMDALDGGDWRFGDDSAPEVGVTFFAGTFVRHPLALAAAQAVLTHLKAEGPQLQRSLNQRTTRLAQELRETAQTLGVPLQVPHFASWFCLRWPADLPQAGLFFAALRLHGLHAWEGRPCFLTTAHTDDDLQRIVQVVRTALIELQQAGLLPAPPHEASVVTPASRSPEASAVAEPPVPGARRGRDREGREAWFVPDPERPGKFLQVMTGAARGQPWARGDAPSRDSSASSTDPRPTDL